ncbi:MAG: transketolase [Acidobacteriota bacterium]
MDTDLKSQELRKQIVRMVYTGKDGHIPSAFSIVDILEILYQNYLKFDPENPEWPDRDYFILSKGHGCVALYAILEKHRFLSPRDLEMFCRPGGVLGEHPDSTRIPGVEASTGSLGHGLPMALGVALGLRLGGKSNKVYVLIGDGECNEGTVWESALVASSLRLGNLCCILDNNGSAAQILPVDPLRSKWEAFGWQVYEVDGHSEKDLTTVLDSLSFAGLGQPKMIIANTVKGKGVPMLEGHGVWHHRIPDPEEFRSIMEALS